MLSNQILHKPINDIKDILGVDCSIWNVDGKCLTCVGEVDGQIQDGVNQFLQSKEDEYIGEDAAYFLIRDNYEAVYVLAIHEVVEQITVVGRLCISQFENLIHAYRERLDKNHFFQNLLLDNLLLVDIFNQAKKLGLDVEQRRVVFMIEPKNETDNIVLETMKGLYATGTKDFVTSIDEGHIILVKALENTEGFKEVNAMAMAIVDTLTGEALVNMRVAYGTIVKELKDVSKSYKEAAMALDVGRIFYEEKNVLAYNELGIGRLIHQLPVALCDMFLREVFAGKAADQFDEETLSTVNQFFENNLNISETARKLYVHRNTLVYRLEKIQKTTGLDVRKFDDALTFKIAMMVASHMKFLQSKQ